MVWHLVGLKKKKETKEVSDKYKLKEFITGTPAL